MQSTTGCYYWWRRRRSWQEVVTLFNELSHERTYWRVILSVSYNDNTATAKLCFVDIDFTVIHRYALYIEQNFGNISRMSTKFCSHLTWKRSWWQTRDSLLTALENPMHWKTIQNLFKVQLADEIDFFGAHVHPLSHAALSNCPEGPYQKTTKAWFVRKDYS